MSCKHFNFQAAVNVIRLTDENNPDNIVGFTTEVKINCADCGMPFEFIGYPKGISMTNTKPMVSIDGKELRSPVKPSTDPADQVYSILKAKA